MVSAFSAFLDFCYLVRRSIHTEDTIRQIEEALAKFHHERKIFEDVGVRDEGLSLPRQHSLVHYVEVIQQFGSPNGLCSSITESKHIKAVKEPWRRSNKCNALGQMLLTNQRLDKLAASRAAFGAQGMLIGPIAEVPDPPAEHPAVMSIVGDGEDTDSEAVDGLLRIPASVSLAKTKARGYPLLLENLTTFFHIDDLPIMAREFLFDQLFPNSHFAGAEQPLALLPSIESNIKVFHSAVAQYYAPSDHCGIGGMIRERIRATPTWQGGPSRNDCVFVYKTDEADILLQGFRALHVARVVLFFSFKHNGTVYPCALVQWFRQVGDAPCPHTNMWMVERAWEEDSEVDDENVRAQITSVIHCGSIYRGAHLIPVFGEENCEKDTTFANSLDRYNCYYVNKFIDHHAHECAF